MTPPITQAEPAACQLCQSLSDVGEGNGLARKHCQPPGEARVFFVFMIAADLIEEDEHE